jgi:inosine/xanthosine triphosphatase
MIKVAIGSTNPVKVESARIAFEQLWPDQKFEFKGINVKSGVSDQPMTLEDAIKGATNRAKRALKSELADYGVGLEGAIEPVGKHWIEFGAVVVVNQSGQMGIGLSPALLVPTKVRKLLKTGLELGAVSDIIFKRTNSSKEEGFFGLMTNHLITRSKGYSYGVVMALTRFLHPEVF